MVYPGSRIFLRRTVVIINSYIISVFQNLVCHLRSCELRNVASFKATFYKPSDHFNFCKRSITKSGVMSAGSTPSTIPYRLFRNK